MSNTKVMAMDISQWSRLVNAEELKNSVNGVIMRCGYRGNTLGEIKKDTRAERYLKLLKKADVPIGLYFVTQALTEQEAYDEADFVIDFIESHKIKPSFPIFVMSDRGNVNKTGRADTISRYERTQYVQAFVDHCNEKGYQAGIAGYIEWINNSLVPSRLTNVMKWLFDADPEIHNRPADTIGFKTGEQKVYPGIGTPCVVSAWYLEIMPGAYKYIPIPEVEEEYEEIEAEFIEVEPEPIDNKANKKYFIGDTIKLRDARIYTTCIAENPIKLVTGEFAIWGNYKRNDRMRICYVEDVGTDNNIGWINIEDIIE